MALMIAAYRLASETFDHPLHLGVTEAGPPPAGLLKGTAGIATLLAEGIGDTIRYSLTADPVEEARGGRQLLEALGFASARASTSSPARRAVGPRSTSSWWPRPRRPLEPQPADPGGGDGLRGERPGEARRADIGIAAGKQKGHLFIRGKIVRVVPEAEMVEALVAEAERLVAEGVEARLAAADSNAEAEAAADRAALLGESSDPNAVAVKIDRIPRVRSERPSPSGSRSGGGRGLCCSCAPAPPDHQSGEAHDRETAQGDGQPLGRLRDGLGGQRHGAAERAVLGVAGTEKRGGERAAAHAVGRVQGQLDVGGHDGALPRVERDGRQAARVRAVSPKLPGAKFTTVSSRSSPVVVVLSSVAGTAQPLVNEALQPYSMLVTPVRLKVCFPPPAVTLTSVVEPDGTENSIVVMPVSSVAGTVNTLLVVTLPSSLASWQLRSPCRWPPCPWRRSSSTSPAQAGCSRS